MQKVFKRIRIKRQKNSAVFSSYVKRYKIEPISANFRPKPKMFEFLDLLHIGRIERAKKTYHAILPLMTVNWMNVINYVNM
jgi:hypothetical protein